ncbi:probable glutamate receptor [Cherax quadricarinatus]|uniref:probable glutamate receptor n=1 Tax=Cherax quadricarinatus TaxID=27406 RepID=UPI00387E6D5B
MGRRQRLRPTTLADRVKLVWLWVEGVPVRIIAQETKTSVTTVCRWVRRWQQEGNVNTKQRKRKASSIHDELRNPLASSDSTQTLAVAGMAVSDVLATVSYPSSIIILLTDGSTSAATLFKTGLLQLPWGVCILEVKVHSADLTNKTQEAVSKMISDARTLRQQSWSVTVVVVSDDTDFLATFAECSVKGRLLVWSTRLLAVTNQPLPQLHQLRKTFSMTNSMLLVADNSLRSVYVHFPYSTQHTQALRIASWSPRQGLILTSHFKLFPDKFSILVNGPTLVVAAEQFKPHIALVKNRSLRTDPSFTGPMVNLLKILAKSMNFTYTYVRPPDESFGAKLADGSWTGMVGMVGRGEADIGLGPFGVTATRADIVDFTKELITETARIMGGRGLPEVNPWSFVLPLTLPVWAATLAALLLVLVTAFMFPLSGLKTSSNSQSFLDVAFGYIGIFLQQAMQVPSSLWWEKLMLATWLIVMFVISKSYAGNLMSNLAVRYIPQPYQSLRDVLDDHSVTMVWVANNAYVQYYRSAQSGIFKEIADSEKKGRIMYAKTSEIPAIIDVLVRRGHHVLIAEDRYEKVLIAQDFSRSGRCDFYSSEARFLPFMSSMIGPKDSPLIPVISKSIKAVTQSGLYDYWTQANMPNASSCAFPPTKMTVNTSLGFRNLWGMFVVLLGGLTLSLIVLALEIIAAQVNI